MTGASNGFRGLVVVITGASSGIGRATALALACRGARLVLAARSEPSLRSLVAECEQLGGRSIAVPTEVTDERAVEDLAAQAIAHFGRIDAWVNNAGVLLMARLDEAPPEANRRVVETNLLGTIYGSAAAPRRFRAQGRGTLVNNAAAPAAAGAGPSSVTAASKAGVRALSEVLRAEVREPGIHISTILPSTLDTPLYRHAANYTGRAVAPPPPIRRTDGVVRAILGCLVNPRREVVVGRAARARLFFRALAPGLSERAAARRSDGDRLAGPPVLPTAGNLSAAREALAA